MAVINDIHVLELQEFYPVTESLAQKKINDVMNNVKNVMFLEMFGFSISKKIFSGDIDDSANDDFMGFRKFVALCIAANFCEETYIHTNAGLKAINQPNWSSPTAATKNTTLIKLNNAIEAQFLEAKKVLNTLDEKPANTYEPYSSFIITRV